MNAPAPSPYRWWVLANAFVIQFIVTGLSWNYVIMLVPEILADLSLDLESWGLLWGSMSLGVCLVAILAGALADRYGVRLIVGAGLLLGAGSLLVRTELTGLWDMFATLVVFGVGMGTLFSNLPKALGIWFPPQQLGLATGVYMAGMGLGIATLGLAIGDLIELFGGWRELSTALGWTTLGLAVLWVLTIRSGEVATDNEVPPVEGVLRVMRLRSVWILTACYFLFVGADLSWAGYIITFLTEVRGMPDETAGLFLIVFSWTFMAGSILLPMFSDRIGRRKPVFMLGVGSAGACILAVPLLSGLPLMFIAAGLGICLGAIALVFIVPLEMNPPGPRLAGSAVGVSITGGFAGGFVGPVISMKLASIDPFIAFAFWCVCYLAAMALFATLRETGPAANKPAKEAVAASALRETA